MSLRKSLWETGPVVGTKWKCVLLHLLRVWGWWGYGHASWIEWTYISRLWWHKWPGGSQESRSEFDACSCLVIVGVFKRHGQRVYCVWFNVYLEIIFTTLRWRVCFAYGFSIHWDSMLLSQISFVCHYVFSGMCNTVVSQIRTLEKIQWVRKADTLMRMQFDPRPPTLPTSDAAFVDLIHRSYGPFFRRWIWSLRYVPSPNCVISRVHLADLPFLTS